MGGSDGLRHRSRRGQVPVTAEALLENSPLATSPSDELQAPLALPGATASIPQVLPGELGVQLGQNVSALG